MRGDAVPEFREQDDGFREAAADPVSGSDVVAEDDLALSVLRLAAFTSVDRRPSLDQRCRQDQRDEGEQPAEGTCNCHVGFLGLGRGRIVTLRSCAYGG